MLLHFLGVTGRALPVCREILHQQSPVVLLWETVETYHFRPDCLTTGLRITPSHMVIAEPLPYEHKVCAASLQKWCFTSSDKKKDKGSGFI